MKLFPRLALYGLMTVLIAGFFTVNASASSLPGDSLYGLKLSWEQAQLALTFDVDSRHDLEMEFEDERLEEVESLLGEGRQEDVEFHGLIESKADGSWVISGISVVVDTQTELKGYLEVGNFVNVEALTQEDGSLLALEIYGEGADLDDMDDDYDNDMDDDLEDDMDDDSDDDMDDDSDDDMDDDSDDDMDDDYDNDMDDDYDNDMDDDLEDDMDDDSDDDMDDDSDDDMDDDYDNDMDDDYDMHERENKEESDESYDGSWSS